MNKGIKSNEGLLLFPLVEVHHGVCGKNSSVGNSELSQEAQI